MANAQESAEFNAQVQAEYDKHRKSAYAAGFVSLGSPVLLFIALFFMSNITSGPFVGFVRAMAWPLVFITGLLSPLSLAVAFVQGVRARNLRWKYGVSKRPKN
jgi:low affinity Fe/Cu permease